MRTFQQILKAAGYKCEAYSGRGMGGEKCLSVSLAADGNGPPSNIGRLFADVLEATRDEYQGHVAVAFRKMRTDSLGKGTVVYFPGVEFES